MICVSHLRFGARRSTDCNDSDWLACADRVSRRGVVLLERLQASLYGTVSFWVVSPKESQANSTSLEDENVSVPRTASMLQLELCLQDRIPGSPCRCDACLVLVVVVGYLQ